MFPEHVMLYDKVPVHVHISSAISRVIFFFQVDVLQSTETPSSLLYSKILKGIFTWVYKIKEFFMSIIIKIYKLYKLYKYYFVPSPIILSKIR